MSKRRRRSTEENQRREAERQAREEREMKRFDKWRLMPVPGEKDHG